MLAVLKSANLGYLYWSENEGRISTELYHENSAFFWTIIFVRTGQVRLKNVGTGTFLAVSQSNLTLESTGSAQGLWTYTVNSDTGLVKLQNIDSAEYLCTAEEPEMMDVCDSIEDWVISFVTNTDAIAMAVLTSVTRTTTSGTATSTTGGESRP